MGQVDGSESALDVLWKDLTIRAAALPGWTDGKATAPEPSPWWLVPAGLALVTALGIAIWWSGARGSGASPRAKGRGR
jgi:hypothetical protein